MSEEIEQEIAAIKSVLAALDPLQPEIRQSVLGYVVRRLKITLTPEDGGGDAASAEDKPRPGAPVTTPPSVPPAPGAPVHIKTFKEQKNPRSDREMSAIVAYYLKNLAPPADRKERITTRDVETYFQIAEYPLPKTVEMTLVNAKAAGYFDSVGNGEYKLNAVGHNLVAHNLPRGAEAARPAHRAGARRNRRPAKGR
jgi:hypothetical protein